MAIEKNITKIQKIPLFISVLLVGSIVLINFVLVFFINRIGSLLNLSQNKISFLVSVHEAVCGLAASMFLALIFKKIEKPPVWIKLLMVSFLAVALGDFFYGIDYYLLGHPFKNTFFMLAHEGPYVVFMGTLSIASFMRAREGLGRIQARWINCLVLFLAISYFICSYTMVLSFQFPADYNRPILNIITSYSYGILQSVAVGALLVASVRARGFSEFLIWLFFLVLNACDFALRYQDVGKYSLGTPFFEFGWALAISMLTCNFLWIYLQSLREVPALRQSPSALNSIRVLVPSLMLLSMTLFLGANLVFSPYLNIANTGMVSGHALIFVIVWIASNLSGVYLSRQLFQRVELVTELIGSGIGIDDVELKYQSLIELDPIVCSLKIMKVKLDDSINEIAQAKSHAAIGLVAAQVSHDIRSPLAALDIVLQDVVGIAEDKRILIRMAVGRIKDIANTLLNKNRQNQGNGDHSKLLSPEIKVPCLISSLIESITTEKRLQFRSKINVEIHLQLSPSSYGAFSIIQPAELKRAISNIINNSVEALPDKGNVEILLKTNENFLEISISDNGLGIPSSVLEKLGQRGETHGKLSGSGLGIYHAKIVAEDCGGSLSIKSNIGVGTVVTISLPRIKSPNWFVDIIRLKADSIVVVLDDDVSIHGVWADRIHSITSSGNIDLIHFSTPDQLRNWHGDSGFNKKDVVYLCDFELIGHSDTGLDLIDALGIAAHAYLVTSHFESLEIQKKCMDLGLRIVPKSMAVWVPFEIVSEKHSVDAVLLDDDNLVHLTWSSVARQNQKSLKSFYDPKIFLEEILNIDRNSPVYIDSNLSNGIRGQDLVPVVQSLGFRKIYICSGYDAETFQNIPGLTAAVGKEPPNCIESS